MKLIIFIILFCCSSVSFGQDSLQIDTTSKMLSSVVEDSVHTDSSSSILKTFERKKNQRKEIPQKKIKGNSIVIKEENTGHVDAGGRSYGFVFIVVLLIGIILFFVFYHLRFTTKYNTTSSKLKEEISDYLKRQFMSRRDYYRNVYLKSEAWKRKRYVVLKRDNWRCLYCGGQATQVHHKKYAKRNIGKEPIEWLVSICKTCHDSKHR